MEGNRSKSLLIFILGAAAGAAIGYFLASGKKDEIISDVKETAAKLKDELKDHYEKGKQVVEEIKNKANEFFNEPTSNS